MLLLYTNLYEAFLISVLGSISDSDVPRHVLSSVTHRPKGSSLRTEMPSRMSISLTGHTKAVTAIDWSTSHGMFLPFVVAFEFTLVTIGLMLSSASFICLLELLCSSSSCFCGA